MASLVRDNNRIINNLSDAEVDALSWSELQKKCRETGILTGGLAGRTQAVLRTELKSYYEKRRLNEKEAGWTSEESSSEDSSDEEDAYVGNDPKKMRIQNIKDQIEIRRRLKKLEKKTVGVNENEKNYNYDDSLERLFVITNGQTTRLDEIEERLNGIVSLLGINEVPELGDDHDQLINADNEHLNQSENRDPGQPMGGKRTRSKLRVRSRRKSSIKKGKKSSSNKSSSKKKTERKKSGKKKTKKK